MCNFTSAGSLFVLFRARCLEARLFFRGDILKGIGLALHKALPPGKFSVLSTTHQEVVFLHSPLENSFAKSIAMLVSGAVHPENFSFSLAGTPFQLRIWSETMRIPFGETVSYGELVKRAGCGSPRAAGQALNRNPLPLIVPCHRVMGKDGRLTGFSSGVDVKEFLLELEQACSASRVAEYTGERRHGTPGKEII